MDNLTFICTDVNLEISIFDQGLLVSNEEHDDGSGTHFIIYKIDDDNYGTGHISERQVNGYIEGTEFMDEEDINDFLHFVGETDTEWKEHSLVTKLFDLISYYGYENIMGTDYNPCSKEFVINNYLK